MMSCFWHTSFKKVLWSQQYTSVDFPFNMSLFNRRYTYQYVMAELKLRSPRCSRKALIFHQPEASSSVPSTIVKAQHIWAALFLLMNRWEIT